MLETEISPCSLRDNEHGQDVADAVHSVLERWEVGDDKIIVRYAVNCASAEWSSVISICKYRSCSNIVTLPDNSTRKISHSFTIPQLYTALSRARVYSTTIVFNYTPNACLYTDRLLNELRQRRDVCRVIE